MNVLFLARHFGCLRNFERAVFRLAEGGHTVHLAAHEADQLGGLQMVERWASSTPAISIGELPAEVETEWSGVAPRLRLMVDYLRYLEPAYANAPRLAQRAAKRTPLAILRATRSRAARSWPARRLLSSALRALERRVPVRPEAAAFLRDRNPDVVLFTPLISLGSAELDYLDAAKALGLRTVFCVWSWDTLSSKSILRTMPDLVTVWNDTQKQEAVTLHRVPPSKVAVTGAQCFDHWFNRKPSKSREAFCGRAGLPADPPFILWVCSALFVGTASESAVVEQWLDALRRSPDARLRLVPVLIRPHPSRLREWQHIDLARFGPVVLLGSNPIDEDAKADYFDSLFYSAAVVGLNTSAFIEAAIVGRPVLTLLLPELFENQEGTLHFHYLLDPESGLLQMARSMDEHLQQLAATLDNPERLEQRSRRFVDRFVRPNGRHVEATTELVRAIEK
ncbi:MAG: hypothetical protein NTY02_18965, partial [Acidobacteria bacterium]|nr:hypothetical protein [Acidobacteriota bacterium]